MHIKIVTGTYWFYERFIMKILGIVSWDGIRIPFTKKTIPWSMVVPTLITMFGFPKTAASPTGSESAALSAHSNETALCPVRSSFSLPITRDPQWAYAYYWQKEHPPLIPECTYDKASKSRLRCITISRSWVSYLNPWGLKDTISFYDYTGLRRLVEYFSGDSATYVLKQISSGHYYLVHKGPQYRTFDCGPTDTSLAPQPLEYHIPRNLIQAHQAYFTWVNTFSVHYQIGGHLSPYFSWHYPDNGPFYNQEYFDSEAIFPCLEPSNLETSNMREIMLRLKILREEFTKISYEAQQATDEARKCLEETLGEPILDGGKYNCMRYPSTSLKYSTECIPIRFNPICFEGPSSEVIFPRRDPDNHCNSYKNAKDKKNCHDRASQISQAHQICQTKIATASQAATVEEVHAREMNDISLEFDWQCKEYRQRLCLIHSPHERDLFVYSKRASSMVTQGIKDRPQSSLV